MRHCSDAIDNMSHACMYDMLVDYLKADVKVEYAEKEMTVLQLDPLQVTDDGKFFMELGSSLDLTRSQ